MAPSSRTYEYIQQFSFFTFFGWSFSDICAFAFWGMFLVESNVFSHKLCLFSLRFLSVFWLNVCCGALVEVLSKYSHCCHRLLFSASARIIQTGRRHKAVKLYSTGLLKHSHFHFLSFFMWLCVCVCVCTRVYVCAFNGISSCLCMCLQFPCALSIMLCLFHLSRHCDVTFIGWSRWELSREAGRGSFTNKLTVPGCGSSLCCLRSVNIPGTQAEASSPSWLHCYK